MPATPLPAIDVGSARTAVHLQRVYDRRSGDGPERGRRGHGGSRSGRCGADARRRYLVVGGRKWLAADPSIPDDLRVQLVSVLMRGRRLVKTCGDLARPVVHDAKVALGERGRPWWDTDVEGQQERLAATIRTLLRHRAEGATICPSEAARVVGGQQWRELMPLNREVAVGLSSQGIVEGRQGGRVIDLLDAVGPVRLAAGPRFERGPE